MALQKIKFSPGVNREGTNLANESGWWSCDKIRFRSGYPEKLGGWTSFLSTAYTGVCRALFNWITLTGANCLAIGTNVKYYVEQGYLPSDITPIRASSTINNNPFSTTSGSATVVVTDTAHGAVSGDYVTFSGAAVVAGLTLNNEYALTYIDANSYSITASSNANATTTGGGAAVVAAYQINVGLPIAVGGTGWGAGNWARSAWGSASTITTSSQLRLWAQDNFGEDLIFCVRDGAVYYWDSSAGGRATLLSSQAGASDVPLMAIDVFVTDDRHVVALGCNPLDDINQDPMFVRWGDTENAVNWTPDITNTAGGQKLVNGSTLITHLKTKQEVLLWTDSALISMQFLGPPYTFGFNQIATNVSIASPMAMASASNSVYWMGQDKFYVYTGQVETLPCTLRQYVFGNINLGQRAQVCCGTNEGFNEVWWFYPSANAEYNDSYVIYNYLERIWYYGSLQRTAWLDSPLRSYPMAAFNGQAYFHENGVDDGSTNPPSAFTANIESADFDLSDGDHVMFVKRLIPDLSFDGSTADNPVASMTVEVRNFPGTNYTKSTASTITRSATVPVQQFDTQFWIRLRGRQAAFKISSADAGVQWQLGAPRLDLQEDGRR